MEKRGGNRLTVRVLGLYVVVHICGRDKEDRKEANDGAGMEVISRDRRNQRMGVRRTLARASGAITFQKSI